MTKHLLLDRRSLLKGLGVGVALPALEAMTPSLLRASTTAAVTTPPRRLAFVYVPNGVNMHTWTPTTLGANFQLPATLEPLAPFREHLTVLSGLTCDKARANGDGPGDHARAMSAFLTGQLSRSISDRRRRHPGHGVSHRSGQRPSAAARRNPLPASEIGCEQRSVAVG